MIGGIMVTSIPLNHDRQELFKELVKEQEDAAGGKDKLRSAKLTIKGETQYAPIYRFRLKDLAYNKSNGRIKAEVLEKEAELGRILDQFKQDDGKLIGEILVSIRQDENEKIKTDLEKNTQINPGIVTADGIVINGNRRKALLTELYENNHDEKFKYLDAHILPPNITRSELWLIEAGIQLSAPQQLVYSPINNLLKLREGINSGLTIADMASRIYGVTEAQIKADLDRLTLIDEYLSAFLGKTEKYYLVRGLDNHFINLQNILNFYVNPKGVRIDWDPTEDDLNELKLVGFYYIRMRMPHLRIRDMKDLFRVKTSWHELRRALSVSPELTTEEQEKFKLEITQEKVPVDDDLFEEDADSENGYETSSEEKDKSEDGAWREERTAELKNIFQDAKEQKEIHDDASKPLTLVKRALKNVQGITEDSENLDDPEIDQVLADIIARINVIRKIIKKSIKS
jgi:hypothetical protein